ncbi:MAG: antibiotic biosynthesis monooxygenase [Chloroflexi bacterium]|nr:antibiotic biosynthesis monooxygenase [Chloroflexota bacterium]
MYGTVAHLRVKPGQEKTVQALSDEWDKTRRPKVKGAVASYVYKLDNKPNEYIMVAVFQDKKTYTANADDPEQDKWYRRFRAALQADPVWEDGEIIWPSR